MTQHIHKAILDQLTEDPSRIVMLKVYDKDGVPATPLEVQDIGFIWHDKQGKNELYIKPRPHPNDKYREAFERGEPVWAKSEDGSWFKLSFAGTETWKFTTKEFSLTDPNPVDPCPPAKARADIWVELAALEAQAADLQKRLAKLLDGKYEQAN